MKQHTARCTLHLVGVQHEERNHEGEEAGGFGEGETKNGVREELTCESIYHQCLAKSVN